MKKHHVILTKYGEDIYIDELTTKSNYPDEKGRIENVITITGNCEPKDNLMLTQQNIVELRDILDIIIEKERNRIGSNEKWGVKPTKNDNGDSLLEKSKESKS